MDPILLKDAAQVELFIYPERDVFIFKDLKLYYNALS